MPGDLELAKRTLLEGGFSLVLAKDGQILATGIHPGIADLLAIAEEKGELLVGSALADRIVGKAAALVARLAGISQVYAQLTSRSALEELSCGGIHLEYDRLVEHILNRDGSGLCPFEKLALGNPDPHQAVEAFRAFLAQVQSLSKKNS